MCIRDRSRIDGNRTVFSENVTPEGTILEFVGLSFEVVEGRLNLMGRSLPVDGPHTLVMVQDGQISAITPLQQWIKWLTTRDNNTMHTEHSIGRV